MEKTWLSVAVAAFTGALMTVQGAVNSALLRRVGIINMAAVVQITGLLVAAAAFLIWGRIGRLAQVTSAPWYSWLGGAIGVVIIAGVAYAIRHVSTSLAISSIITAQLATALVVDHFGLFGSEKVGLSWLRAAGLILMVIGTRLMVAR